MAITIKADYEVGKELLNNCCSKINQIVRLNNKISDMLVQAQDSYKTNFATYVYQKFLEIDMIRTKNYKRFVVLMEVINTLREALDNYYDVSTTDDGVVKKSSLADTPNSTYGSSSGHTNGQNGSRSGSSYGSNTPASSTGSGNGSRGSTPAYSGYGSSSGHTNGQNGSRSGSQYGSNTPSSSSGRSNESAGTTPAYSGYGSSDGVRENGRPNGYTAPQEDRGYDGPTYGPGEITRVSEEERERQRQEKIQAQEQFKQDTRRTEVVLPEPTAPIDTKINYGYTPYEEEFEPSGSDVGDPISLPEEKVEAVDPINYGLTEEPTKDWE